MKKKTIFKTLLSIPVLLLISISLFAQYIHWALYRVESVILVIPNEYEGWIRVVEDKENYDPPYYAALENYHVLELHVGDDHLLKVKSIRDFRAWAEINMSFEWVEPVIYCAEDDSKESSWNVFGEAVYLSGNEFCFWTGKRERLHEAYVLKKNIFLATGKAVESSSSE